MAPRRHEVLGINNKEIKKKKKKKEKKSNNNNNDDKDMKTKGLHFVYDAFVSPSPLAITRSQTPRNSFREPKGGDRGGC